MAIRYLRQRRGRWLVQVAVPADLRAHFGRANIERYLLTSDRREAERRSHIVVAEILESFTRARSGRPLDMKQMAEAELRRVYDRLAADFLASHSKLPGIAEAVAEDLAAPWSGLVQGNPLLGQATGDYARKMIARAGGRPTEDAVGALTEAILRAHAAAVAMLQRGITPPPLPGQPARPTATGTGPGVAAVANAYLAERQRDASARLTAQTEAQMRATFRLFADHVEDRPLRSTTREHAVSFLDAVAGLDPHYGRRPGAADLSLSELLKRFPAKDGGGLSNRTVNRHQSALKTLFRWARKRGYVEGENPFADLSRAEAPLSKTTWQPFDAGELKALFAGAVFETRPARHSLITARAWVMAIALYSGMRVGEICDLDAENVRERDGIPYFDITTAKSEAGVRLVPVHSALIQLGLLEYARAIGSGPLFPGIAPGGPDRKRAHTLSKRFAAFRRDRGVTRARVAFHSFRKSFVGVLERAGVDRDRAALIIGHERGFTFRVYNPAGVDLAALQEVVEAVRYPGLGLRPMPHRTVNFARASTALN